MNDHAEEELVSKLKRLGEVRPTPKDTERALDRVRRVLETQNRIKSPSRRSLVWKCAIAVAAGLLLVAGLFEFFWSAPSQARASFADLLAALKSSHSVTFRETTRVDGKPADTMRLTVLDNGLGRDEHADGRYTVFDTSKYRQLAVDPKKRTARLLKGINMPQVNLYGLIKNLPSDASARPLSDNEINGKKALGFAVKVQGQELTVWADAKTRLPVLIEATGKDDKGKTSTAVLDEFVFDRELDPRLFSFDVPADYKLATLGVDELPAAPTDPKLRDLVVTPLVGIGPVKFGMSRKEVEHLLGKADGVQEVGSRGYVDMNYGSRGIFLGVGKELGVVAISCTSQKPQLLRVRDFSGKTDKGISLGASSADIIRAYGEPERKETRVDTVVLYYDRLRCWFTLSDDRLISMYFGKPAKKE